MFAEWAESYNKRPRLDSGFVALQSTDGVRVVACICDRTHRVSMNPSIYSCIHSNPKISGLAPGAKEQRRMTIYFLEASLEDLWTRAQDDFRGVLVAAD